MLIIAATIYHCMISFKFLDDDQSRKESTDVISNDTLFNEFPARFTTLETLSD